MAAYNFPDTTGQLTDGSFTYTAPTGEIYSWNGYSWVTAESTDAGTYVKKAGDSMSGDLEINAKATSFATQSSDPDSTLATKGYVDTNVSTAGVSSIIAGSGISVDKATGDVTITNTGSGNGGGGDNGGGSVESKADIYGTAKAWGSVASAGTLVSGKNCTVARSSTGEYVVTFAEEMADADYTVNVSVESTLSGSTQRNYVYRDKTKSSFVISINNGSNLSDLSFSFAVFDNEPAEIIVGSGTVANTNIYGTAKAWARVASNGTPYSQTGCTVTRQSDPGLYAIILDSLPTNKNFSVTAVAEDGANLVERTNASEPGKFYIQIKDRATGASANGGFNFTVHDDEPAEVALTTFGDVINYSGAAAWGWANGNTGAFNGSMNATGTRTGVGTYVVTFNTPMPDANYSITTSLSNAGNSNGLTRIVSTGDQTATGFRVFIKNADDLVLDWDYSFSVHSLNALPPKGGTGTDSWGSVAADGTLDASFNVASVTKTGTGAYDVVFTTPMPSSAYAVNVSSTQFQDTPSNTNAISKTKNGFSISVTYKGADGSVVYWDSSFAFSVNATNAKLPNSFTEEEIQSVVDLAQSGATNPGASAWGKIASNGTLNGGLNVASVTRTGEGEYDVVFVTPMPDSNYSVVACTSRADTTTAGSLIQDQSATGFSIRTFNNTTGARLDRTCYFTVFATNSLPLKGGTGTDAWASVLGTVVTGANSVTASFNINSVTRTGQGVYEVVFTTPMPTANYAVTLGGAAANVRDRNHTTNGFTVETLDLSGSFSDTDFSFTVNATNAKLPNSFTEEELQTILDFSQSGASNPGASAWGDVAADGTLEAGLNIASVTKTGTGEYTYVFASPLPSDKYSVVASVDEKSHVACCTTNQTATGFVITVFGGAQVDKAHSFTVFATNALPLKGGAGTDSWATVDKTTSNGACNVPGSFNVASVTRTAAGIYDVVFTTPMPTTNYSIQGSSNTTDATSFPRVFTWDKKTTAGFEIKIIGNTTATDEKFAFTVNATNATLPSTITQEEADLIIDTIKGGGVAQKVAILADVKPTATDAGSSVSGWQDRTLNTIKSDTGNLVTLANNKEFTLKAGTYLIEWSAPAFWSQNHQTRLTNVTTGSTEQLGSNEYTNTDATGATYTAQTRSFGSTRVNITSDTTYKIEQYIKRGVATNGLGVKSSSGEISIYTQVTITDLAVLAAGGGSGGGGTTEIYGTAKAWGSVDTDGTLESGSANVSTSGNSPYTVTFSAPMADADYTVTFGGEAFPVVLNGTKTVNGFSYNVYDAAGAIVTAYKPSFAVFNNEPITVSGGGSSGGGSTEIYGTAKAWGSVAADGTLEGGLNCAVTKTATGLYSIVFSNPLPSDNYSVTSGFASGSTGVVNTSDKTSTGFTARTYNPADNLFTDRPFDFAVHDDEPITVSGGAGGGDITYNGASAWANFDGTIAGTNAPRNALNVKSVTRVSAGVYDVLFTTPLGNANYAVTSNYTGKATLLTPEGFNIIFHNANDGSQEDTLIASFAVHSENTIAPQSGVGADSWATVDETTVNGPCNVPGSFNVKSMTRTGTGQYEVVFTTPMPTTNYSIAASILSDTAGYYSSAIGSSKLTTGFTMRTGLFDGSNKAYDYPFAFNVNASSTITPTYTWTRDGTTLKPANDGDDIEVGAAAFAGNITSTVTSGSSLTLNKPTGGSISLNATSNGTSTSLGNSSSDILQLYGATSATASKVVFDICSDNASYGSFGDVLIGGTLPSAPNIQLSANGRIECSRSDQSISYALVVFDKSGGGNTESAYIRANGSAVFKGGVTQSNAFITLEDENPANFSADGEYTGPTLDVKDRIINLVSRLDAIEANEIIDDATDTSLLQLLANASSRLDSIEVRLAALEGN